MHTITSKLTKQAVKREAGQGHVFLMNISESYFDRGDKQRKYTNYQAAVYANSNQVELFEKNLVPGCVVTISGKTAAIKSYESNGNTRYFIQLNDCSLDNFFLNESNNSAPVANNTNRNTEIKDDDIPF